jgi:uncharacterized membrane protein YraQ (UPF0718 family)
VKTIKLYLLFIMVIIADLILFIVNPSLGIRVAVNTGANFLQMLAVLPPIFILIGLLDVWVPREKFMRYMGESSGATGAALSVFLGAAAAGPLYAAFPLAGMMINKGVKFSNIIIFLGAWSTMKIPMFLFEITSLGSAFAITRWVISLIAILVMGLLINKIVTVEEKEAVYKLHAS